MAFGVSMRFADGDGLQMTQRYTMGGMWSSSFLPADFDVAIVATNHTMFFWPMAHG